MKWSLLVLVLVCFVSAVIGLKFPSELQKCNYNDTTCIKDQMNIAISKLITTGSAKLNLVPLDPVAIDGFEIEQGGNSPINLVISFKNAKIHGLSTARVVRVSGFSKNPDKARHEVQYTAPSLSLVGDYTANGQILVLPIAGKGKANLTMENVDMVYKAVTKSVVRNGEVYLEIVKARYAYNSLERLHMNFEKLFMNDPQLNGNINNFLNENWQTIFEELKPKIGDVFGEITTQIINNVFTKRPYKDFFKEDAQ